jgi:hypothetical protein
MKLPRACPNHPRGGSLEIPLTHSLEILLLLMLVVTSAKMAGARATRTREPMLPMIGDAAP